jgi:ankyrin repeat protein
MSRSELLEDVRAGDKSAADRALAEDPSLISITTDEGVSLVRHALYNGKRPLAVWLVERGATVDPFDAAALGDVQRLRSLLAEEPGSIAAHSSDGWTPLHLAAFFGQLEAVRCLLAAGAPTATLARNANGNTALHAGVAGGSSAVIEALLAAGADPNAREANGLTPLHLAAHAGNESFLRSLLGAGADSDLRAGDGRRPVNMLRPPLNPTLLNLLGGS